MTDNPVFDSTASSKAVQHDQTNITLDAAMDATTPQNALETQPRGRQVSKTSTKTSSSAQRGEEVVTVKSIIAKPTDSLIDLDRVAGFSDALLRQVTFFNDL